MQHRSIFHFSSVLTMLSAVALLSGFVFQSCSKEDPKPVNPEEVITTVKITLVAEGDGAVVTFTFSDPDGPLGSLDATITASGPLRSSTNYSAVMDLVNDAVSPARNVSEEIADEADAHLFCFATTGNIVITYEDQDENGLPLGLVTAWATGAAGNAEVTVTLRHQPETKTGECPGTGETDVEISFPVVVE